MKIGVITQYQIERRKFWVDELIKLSGNFGADSEKVEAKIAAEIQIDGLPALIGHLRLCGAIPENYGHDTSEEKLYSKYTDVVIAKAFSTIGLTSLVLKVRADVADVECVTNNYSFVADAKAFRLSRTAKNQKDFKVQAMDNWKRGNPYAMVVSPVYQLPAYTSQIYEQASARSVCIGTYTHLAVLVQYATAVSQSRALDLLHEIFKTVQAMNPSKSASAYWQAVNRTMLGFDKIVNEIWASEKQASLDSIYLAKQEALHFLAEERRRIMMLTREEAVKEVLKQSKIESKIRTINLVGENGILSEL